MSFIAPSMFTSGIDKELAALDIYNIEGNDIVNITPDIENLFLNATKTLSFQPDVEALNNLKIIKGVDAKGLLVDANALKDGILASASDTMAAFRTLPAEMQNKLLAVDGYNAISTTINGVTKMISNANLSTIEGLGTLIRNISGCPFPISVFDRNGSILFGSNLIRQASLYGLFGAYGAFIACMENRYIGSGITRRVVPTMIMDSSVGLFKEIADSEFASEVKTYAPNIVKDFASNFKLPANTSTNQYKTILSDCMYCFNKVDSNWNKYGNYTDFSSLNKASPDFKSLLDIGRATTDISIPNNLSNLNTSQIDRNTLLYGVSDIVSKNKKLSSNVNTLLTLDFPFIT